MAVVAGTAVAAGLALTLSVPFIALHEMYVKRSKKQMSRHIARGRKNVRFPCERREVAPPAPLPPIEARVEKKKFVPIFVETAPISPPAYKSALRRSSPPPSYDSSFTFEKTTIEACAELPPRPRQTVRFAERA